MFRSEFERAIIDDEKQHHRVTSFFQRTAPELVDGVELYKGKQAAVREYGVEEAIHSTLSRRVDLPSGGYLMIDYAEALTVIDVNTGSFTGRGKGSLEDTITKVNTEAAEEVVRQLRLRDIGGIIVIDFIDMARARNRDQVLKTLRKALDEDRTKTYVVEISPLGLVEMTRQNVTDGVREILTKRCPTCDGEGVVLSEETVAIEVGASCATSSPRTREPRRFLIRVHPKVAAMLIGGGDSGLAELEEETGKHFHFEGGEALPIDTFDVIETGHPGEDRGARAAVQGRRGGAGEIEEPHMYNVDDAIARIDGYIVSVSGGGAVRRRAQAGADRAGSSGRRRWPRCRGVEASDGDGAGGPERGRAASGLESVRAPAGVDAERPPRRPRATFGRRHREFRATERHQRPVD